MGQQLTFNLLYIEVDSDRERLRMMKDDQGKYQLQCK